MLAAGSAACRILTGILHVLAGNQQTVFKDGLVVGKVLCAATFYETSEERHVDEASGRNTDAYIHTDKHTHHTLYVLDRMEVQHTQQKRWECRSRVQLGGVNLYWPEYIH